MTETLRRSGVIVCERIKKMFLNGECDHLTAADMETWMQLSNPEKYYTGEEAMKYLHISNTRFYNYRKAKLIGDPVKIKGFHKPLYPKAVLDKSMERLNSMTPGQIRVAVLSAKVAEKNKKREELLNKFNRCDNKC